MIRPVEMEIEIEKIVKKTERGTKEQIVSIIHHLNLRRLELSVQLYNDANESIKSDYIIVEGAHYDDVFGMSSNVFPSDEEIWRVIDNMRND